MMSPVLSPLKIQFVDAARIALALIKDNLPEEHGQAGLPRPGADWNAP